MSDLDFGIPFHDSAPRSRVARHRRRRQRGAERRRSFIVFVVMVAVFGVLAGGAWYGYGEVKSFLTTPDYTGQGVGEVTVEVQQGDTVTDIANALYKAGVVKSAKAFTKASSDNPAAEGLQPGTYALRKQMSGVAALTMMLDPASKNVRTFLIKEGLTVVEILPQIAKQTGIPLAELQAAAKDPAGLGVPSWARLNGGPLILEGFLFPAKYEFDAKATAKSVLSQMVAKTVEVIEEDGYAEKAAAIGRTPIELLIVASLVQVEGVQDDFGKVAQVVYNRLNETEGALRYLQFDSTTQYWLIKTGQGRKKFVTRDQLTDPDNNYSTHLDRLIGLPPTPVSNPGKAALDAAAQPEKGPWTYFVVTETDGHSSFTDKLRVHERNVQKCKQIGRC